MDVANVWIICEQPVRHLGCGMKCETQCDPDHWDCGWDIESNKSTI